jgi:hypothetical protein
MSPLRRLMEIVRAGVLRTYAEIGLLRSAPKHLKIFTTCKENHDPHVEFFSSNSEVWKKKIWDSEVSKQ